MTEISHTRLLTRKISDFCRLRLDPVLTPQGSARTREYLLNLISRAQTPPRRPRGYDWQEIAIQCGLNENALRTARDEIERALDAIGRNANASPKRATVGDSCNAKLKRPKRGRPQPVPAKASSACRDRNVDRPAREAALERQKPGIKPRDIEEFPQPLFEERFDLPTFQTALDFQMRRHGDSYWHLHRAVVRDDESLDRSTIRHWLQGSNRRAA